MRRRSMVFATVALLGSTAAAVAGPVRVGSKPFAEGVILEQMGAQLLTASGTPATAEPPTPAVWAALLAGDVDAYAEYTGTLSHTLFEDGRRRTLAELRAALAGRGIGATDLLGFSDNYALGMVERRAAALNVRTISDLRDHPELAFGFASDFLAQKGDGWPSLKAAYGLPQGNVRGMDHAVAYAGVAAGSLDATELYTTDAEVKANGLRVLVDDRHFFPEDQALFLYRLKAADADRTLVPTLGRLVGKVSVGQMRAMNARARLDHVPEAVVAAEFLRDAVGVPVPASLAAEAARPVPVWRQMLPYLWQHLYLVGISLAAAVAVGVPLGVVAAESRRVGFVVLAVVSGIYTIPSLALLVFMIPVLHTGPTPAIVALFLYSLLPIVRSTQSGLRGISPSLRESAEVLGLSRWARLVRVDLQLASPAIVAGIKTSAVLNVGTATLGALIGAGGLGEPIFTGIRLDNRPLYYTAAVFAAALALLIQGGFDWVEPLVVPRGLRQSAKQKPAAVG